MIRTILALSLMISPAFAGEIWITNESDDTISVIYDQIAKWDAMTPRDDIKNLVLTHHRTTVSV